MRVIEVLTAALLLVYPLAVWLGLNYLPPGVLAGMLCLLLLLRLVLKRQQLKAMALPLLAGVLLTAGSLLAKRQDWLLYYPIVINLTMLGVFGQSLLRGPSMVERLARLGEPDLPDKAIPYLRKVTALWCLLFVVNGGMAFYTAHFTSLEIWTLYNGLIAYILMGILAGGEWLYRTFVLKRGA
ncbi:hypothetical protein MJ923_13340 [Shewanella sp. 3B26]|uniref:DNA gyrase subunit B n=1 Tax=Shewanella zhuhaiensis TaxID=2919576 RepID=A0AAJ1BK78_9GAMM|nr:hypothetical protein [Shewanella zhuhaiensis]MCH4295289.1 hypothetical protein [Shewanella zhuhaiensis]